MEVAILGATNQIARRFGYHVRYCCYCDSMSASRCQVVSSELWEFLQFDLEFTSMKKK